MTGETPISPPIFPPKGDVWLRVGEQTFTLANEEAWALAWQIIGNLIDQRDRAAA